MKTKYQYEVTDTSFNRANYRDLIGKILDKPPAYAQVRIIMNKPSMREIFRLQSRMFEEKEAGDMVEDFVIKCLRAGYEQNEIISGIQEFYHQAPEVGNQIFTRVVVKMKNLGKNLNQLIQPKKAMRDMSNWYKMAQDNSNWTPEERNELEIFSEAVSELERNDRNARVHVAKNVIGDNTLFFSIESEYIVSTQVEPMRDRFANSLYIEKVASDLFEVNINETGFKQYNSFEDIKNIVYSFPQ